tara:strand:- start:1769 stop:2437 length:669 start_codon:yes stop_codon:yes gene_type:complete
MVFMNKLNIILVFSTILFLSCSSGSVYSELFNNLGILFKPPSDIPQEDVNSVKYSTMQVRIGRSPNTLIVLEEVQDDILKWTSSNFVKIYTKEGMIVKVSGLENELEIKDIDRRHPILTKKYPEKGVINLTNFYTFSNPDLHLLPVKTSFRFDKIEKIKILGEEVLTKVYFEEARDNLISWKFNNKYWINLDGDIVKSIESFTPKNQFAHMLVTKKYRKPEN